MYWPGLGGEYLAETDLTGAINEEYIYFNGERIARVDRPSGAVHYYFSDQLGSASVITDASGNVQQQYYYFPYGAWYRAAAAIPTITSSPAKNGTAKAGWITSARDTTLLRWEDS
jgi:hypothetical protein